MTVEAIRLLRGPTERHLINGARTTARCDVTDPHAVVRYPLSQKSLEIVTRLVSSSKVPMPTRGTVRFSGSLPTSQRPQKRRRAWRGRRPDQRPDAPFLLPILALVIYLDKVQVFVQLPSEPCIVGEPCHENLIRLTTETVEYEATA